MKRKFTNEEWETIRSFKDEWTQLDTFYRNWALKESFIKAIGVGLGFELQRLEFDISPLNLDIGQVYKETRLFLDGEEEKEWAFEESKRNEHHFVAVALRKEKAMATHSSTLAWKIPRAEEPGRLQFMGSRRVGHD